MAALRSFLGFVVLCTTARLCAAYSLAQSQQSFQWPVPQSQQTFDVKQPASQMDPIPICTMDDSEKVQCGEPSISPANCQAINCCFDGQQCYYGKTGKCLYSYFFFFCVCVVCSLIGVLFLFTS